MILVIGFQDQITTLSRGSMLIPVVLSWFAPGIRVSRILLSGYVARKLRYKMSLIQDLNREKNRNGLVSGRLKVNEYDDAEKNVSAHINSKDWSIEVNVKRDFNPIRDRRQKAYARAKKIE